MKPFPHQNQTREERIFNYRLSRARRTVENAFGILANRFRVFLSPINLPPVKTEKVVLACTAVHNFLRWNFGGRYMPVGSVDAEHFVGGTINPGYWRQTRQLLGLQRFPPNATTVGNNTCTQYMNYFNGEGAVPWQNMMTNVLQ